MATYNLSLIGGLVFMIGGMLVFIGTTEKGAIKTPITIVGAVLLILGLFMLVS